ncbi:hypothetical protein M9194_08305 [Vibrio sp. S4M6]|uniref:hypothetical protein n=1 Tax=Vibrio sinus TaxID=2946865 RepID=UPI002029C85A|nr:hypothetical protein [Vibrio sinus]MCL9781427.1 hypothetical protein [Vibrio sinus]
MIRILLMVVFSSFFLIGCSSNPAPLGSTVANLAQAQTYNPEAAQENLGYIPEGHGERHENVYQIYTRIEEVSLQGTESRVVEGVSE